MTLPLGQRTLRERSAWHSLVEDFPESKGFRHAIDKKPLTLRAWAWARCVTAVLHVLCRCNWTPGTRKIPLVQADRWRLAGSDQSSTMVTFVIATGESGRSRLFRGALTILSTMSIPFVTWPKRV